MYVYWRLIMGLIQGYVSLSHFVEGWQFKVIEGFLVTAEAWWDVRAGQDWWAEKQRGIQWMGGLNQVQEQVYLK